MENEEKTALPVMIVNHGDVWGHGGNWYLFYCPNCKRQVSDRDNCPYCSQKIDWTVSQEYK